MATADPGFWTSALPVIGTIAGGVLVAITTAVTTGQRDRAERHEKYETQQRTVFVNFMQEFSRWRRVSLIMEDFARARPESSDLTSEIKDFSLIEFDLERAIIELRVLVRKERPYRLLSDLPDWLVNFRELVKNIATADRDEYSNLLVRCRKVREDVIGAARLIEFDLTFDENLSSRSIGSRVVARVSFAFRRHRK